MEMTPNGGLDIGPFHDYWLGPRSGLRPVQLHTTTVQHSCLVSKEKKILVEYFFLKKKHSWPTLVHTGNFHKSAPPNWFDKQVEIGLD
jgi:hypothetical protein